MLEILFLFYNLFMRDLFVKCNPNPRRKSVGDCTIRAISIALEQSWDKTYIGVCNQGFDMCDMPSANHVWGAYLKNHGFKRTVIREGEDYTIRDFCLDVPHGTFVLACSGHVVAVIDGKYYDTWDSGDVVPLYCWERK